MMISDQVLHAALSLLEIYIVIFSAIESAVNMQTIQQSYVNSINELNQELFAVQNQCEEWDMRNKELETEKERLKSQLESQSVAVNQDERDTQTFGK
jgi:septal ring factor EnvC (AmiA/AmiB activator)